MEKSKDEKSRAKTFKDYLVFWLFYDKALDCRQIATDINDILYPVGNQYSVVIYITYINSRNQLRNSLVRRSELSELHREFRDMKLKLLVE